MAAVRLRRRRDRTVSDRAERGVVIIEGWAGFPKRNLSSIRRRIFWVTSKETSSLRFESTVWG